MIIINVVSYNGSPLPQRLVGQFDELGGNIGRAENNQLVLPDPERGKTLECNDGCCHVPADVVWRRLHL